MSFSNVESSIVEFINHSLFNIDNMAYNNSINCLKFHFHSSLEYIDIKKHKFLLGKKQIIDTQRIHQFVHQSKQQLKAILR